ncbi:NAD(P)/FAD-dependent oxidoreductase [Spongisporangium articulatum]|uniref:NAD(P)/FAD-dependent oxidoreductase n=1 Tax=Spongisporangium articulatum TaxID=3362603 RepID=A0ABW8ALG4_9ACTN
MSDELQDGYEVVVVGGGAAGLNGALMLARSRRSVLVLDGGQPRNAPAQAVHGLFARDGVPPAELLATGRDEVRRYGGQVVEAQVEDVRPDDGSPVPAFVVRLVGGEEVGARRVLVATGAVDRFPEIPGLAQRWGRDVVHCPYCHGWEVRDRVIGVLATGPAAMHQVLLFRQLSEHVVLLANGLDLPSDEAAEHCAALGVRVVHAPVAQVLVDDDALVGVRLADGSRVELGAVAVASRVEARADFLAGVGVKVVEHESGLFSHVPSTDAFGRTAVPGLWVAGNVTEPMAQVGASAAAGAMAGAQINMELVMEGVQRLRMAP